MNRMKLDIRELRLTIMIAVFSAGVPIVHAGAIIRAPGDQDLWTMKFHAELNQPNQKRPIEIDLSGELICTISAVGSGKYDAALELTNVAISGDVNPDAVRKQLERRLTRRFWGTYSGNGALMSIHFYRDIPPSDRNLLQMIATEIQLVRPDAERSVWTVLERDG